MEAVGFVTFLFKLVFYWPFRFLFVICGWIYEKNQDARLEQSRRQSDLRSAKFERDQEASRRSRNTLYGESPQSNE